ncbi:MAG: hypothetical protein FWF92_09350 [Oscillospiraceae bacterium]|nr:hypothetical protein [Oscillospiraceae bacterium]
MSYLKEYENSTISELETLAANNNTDAMIELAYAYDSKGNELIAIQEGDDAFELYELAESWFEKAFSNGENRQKHSQALSKLYSILSQCNMAYELYDKAIKYADKSNEPYAKIIKFACLCSSVGDLGSLSAEEKNRIFNELSEAVTSSELADHELSQGYDGLSMLYRYGIGTKIDDNVSYECLVRAAQLGSERAKKLMGKYKKKLFGGYQYIGNR